MAHGRVLILLAWRFELDRVLGCLHMPHLMAFRWPGELKWDIAFTEAQWPDPFLEGGVLTVLMTS